MRGLEMAVGNIAAARYVGRVGGLAVALGVGTAVFVGAGSAWADAPSSDSSSGTAHSGKSTAGAKSASKSSSRRVVSQPAGVVAEPTAEVSEVPDLPTEVDDSSSGGNPSAPTGSAELAALGLSRREGARAEAARQTASAVASSSASALGSTIVTDPSVEWVDGILRGTVGATSSRDLPLTYTLIDAPSLGSKITFANPDPEGQFSYLADMSAVTSSSVNEQFSILVAETTGFDSFLSSIPILGLFVPSLLTTLHQIPILGTLLAPIIGSSELVQFNENANTLADDRPVAFTYMMPSFDGTLISVNYFPSTEVASGDADTAPLVLNGPGLGAAGYTDPDAIIGDGSGRSPGLAVLRSDQVPDGYQGEAGYNVITWDPRGEFASGGILQLDSPFWEGRDVSSIIDWAISSGNPAQSQIALEDDDDPLLGMVGASYGGGIQLVTAGTPDKRIDAIVPTIAWNSLNDSLYPSDAFKTAYGSLLLLGLVTTGARINHQIYNAVLTGDLIGWISEVSQAVIAASGPTMLVNNIDIPTLFVQGSADVLFPLQQALQNAEQIATANPAVPVKTTWFCGGHGPCLDPAFAAQDAMIMSANMRWLDQYVAGDDSDPADEIPNFQWIDQTGVYHSSDLAPYDPDFNNADELEYTGVGGNMVVVPVLGGSGPQSATSLPYSLGLAAEARNALNVDVPLPVGTSIAGAPTLSFTYTGLGTTRFVFAQLVDNATGRVVGNINTPVPVTFDGRQHTVEISMEDIAYTSYDAGDTLTLQITSSATAFWNFTSYGLTNISNIKLEIPTVAAP